MKKLLALLSVAIVSTISHLYVISLPFAARTPLLAVEAVFSLILLATLLFASAAIGSAVIRRLGLVKELDSSSLLPAIGIGLGFVAYVVLIVGLVGWLFSWLFIAVAVATVLIFRRELPAVWRVVADWRPRLGRAGLEMLVICLLLVYFLLGAVSTLGPVVDYDAQMYHLGAPKLYVESHAITWPSENTHANFPETVEMLYTVGLLFGTDQFARMLNFAFGVLTAFGLFQFGASRFGKSVGLYAVLAFASVPLVASAAGRAGVDLGLAFFEFLAVCALFNWLTSRKLAWMALSGAFAGLAMGTKYTGLQFAIALGIACALALLLTRTKGLRNWAGSLAVPSLTAAAVASIWYLKNWLALGNPVYPVYFGGLGWSVKRLQLFQDSFSGFGFGHDFVGYLTLIPNMIVFPGRFTLDPPGLVSAFFLLAPFAVLVRRRDPTVLILACICLLQFALWSTGMQETRFLLPMLPWLSLLAAAVVQQGLESPRGITIAATRVFVVLAGVTFLLLQMPRTDLGGLRVTVGLESREEYLASNFVEYPSIDFINQNLPADAEVLLLWRNRGYYLERTYLPDDFYDRFGILYEQEGSFPAAVSRLKTMGVTHILVNRKDLPLWEADANSVFHRDVLLFDTFREDYLVSVYRDEENEVLALKS